MSLRETRGKTVLPTVEEVIANHKDIVVNGNYCMAVMPDDTKVFYIEATEALIDENPENWRVIMSKNHNVPFIVPINDDSNKFDKSKFIN